MPSAENKFEKGGLGKRRAEEPQPSAAPTCMLVAPVADPGSGGAVPSGQEERRSFHREEAFADAAREETQTVSQGIALLSLEEQKQEERLDSWNEYFGSFAQNRFISNYFVGRELPPKSTANITEKPRKAEHVPGAVLPTEVEPEQAEGINLWLYFGLESLDERSTFLNGD